jgi:prepilin-type N-terminal cleavage/methylation domain-containing protein
MISHVGPRGLVPYVRNIRRRIKTGGRYVHHALMTTYHRRPLDAQVGIAFNKKYVWPGFDWFTLVELIMTIVVLGVLAVTAISRFAELSNEADKAVFVTIKANLATAMQPDHSRSLVYNQTAGSVN